MKKTKQIEVTVCDVCGSEGRVAPCIFCGKDVCENCNVFDLDHKRVVLKMGLDERPIVSCKACIELNRPIQDILNILDAMEQTTKIGIIKDIEKEAFGAVKEDEVKAVKKHESK